MPQDPSFFGGRGSNADGEPLAGMTRLRASRVFDSQEPSELDGAVEQLYRENLVAEGDTQDWSGLTHRVMRGVVENLSDREDSDWAIRRASQGAVLAVAKRWGNIVLAGKASVAATREAACRFGLDSARAAQQAGLGAIDGALQVGPVAYPVLQREIAPMVEDFQEVLDEQRRASSREWILAPSDRPLLTAPATRAEGTPAVRIEATPAHRAEATPAHRAEATPAHRAEAAPSVRLEATPSVGPTPSVRLEVAPSVRVEAEPTVRAEAEPAAAAAVVAPSSSVQPAVEAAKVAEVQATTAAELTETSRDAATPPAVPDQRSVPGAKPPEEEPPVAEPRPVGFWGRLVRWLKGWGKGKSA